MTDRVIRVYDPPMCCSTGVCGPQVDSRLVSFAADLQWIGSKGVRVERFNLAQQPAAFAQSPAVLGLLEADGTSSLPIVTVGEEVVSRGTYPSRAELAAMAGLSGDEG